MSDSLSLKLRIPILSSSIEGRESSTAMYLHTELMLSLIIETISIKLLILNYSLDIPLSFGQAAEDTRKAWASKFAKLDVIRLNIFAKAWAIGELMC